MGLLGLQIPRREGGGCVLIRGHSEPGEGPVPLRPSCYLGSPCSLLSYVPVSADVESSNLAQKKAKQRLSFLPWEVGGDIPRESCGAALPSGLPCVRGRSSLFSLGPREGRGASPGTAGERDEERDHRHLEQPCLSQHCLIQRLLMWVLQPACPSQWEAITDFHPWLLLTPRLVMSVWHFELLPGITGTTIYLSFATTIEMSMISTSLL